MHLKNDKIKHLRNGRRTKNQTACREAQKLLDSLDGCSVSLKASVKCLNMKHVRWKCELMGCFWNKVLKTV